MRHPQDDTRRSRSEETPIIRTAALVMLAALLLSGCAVSSVPPKPDEPPAPDGWKPVWVDDFSGVAGLPAPSRWTAETGGTGWGNAELEYYTAGARNAQLDGSGHLALTARASSESLPCWYGSCLYTSARLTTAGSKDVTYGRIEARMKVPTGAGLWSAFWMLGAPTAPNNWPADGEIDVMENVGSEPSTVHGSLHGPGYSGASALTASFTLRNGAILSDAFHIFGVEWTANSIQYFVDGDLYATQTPAAAGSNAWVFRHPFSLTLNLAVGGTWPGSPAQETVFPATLLVDYVAVYRR